MDFGIAKGLGDGKGGLIAGTPAYMSPEQAKGDELDARADVFSAGVVLAEMVEPRGIHSFEDRQKVWEAIHQETPEIAETPWSKVIGQCVSGDRETRYATAAELARALEEVTLRAVGDDSARPYPGLASFQKEDAKFFYGRELEVEALWKKLRRPHLLAVIGPSGAGKSSFLRAGLLPTLTEGWQVVITTPGNRPFDQLAQALTPQLGDAPGVAELLQRFEDPDIAIELFSQWRQQSKHSLIILDQFEELFTQNSEAVQASFAELLGRLPLETDLFVLLSMRDDFLYHCHRFEAFQPILTDLTLLGPPIGAALRRALVEPALRSGYRFEDESIIEEMLSEVEGQRGALPLLAFAAAQLWERRDRETGLLTRKSYEQIGGVGGALAQHAEAILDYIGESNASIIRELFRNLVTAQGTRASRDRVELLSVFPETEGKPFLEPSRVQPTPTPLPRRPAAKHVLNSLIDARLLTSYEIPADKEGDEPHHRIEVVHESLLARWPRLVRWQRQDADSAQMRDELRSQARLWNEHGRSEDYLWTGTAFKEYALWRERYPGGLTETEKAFGAAMVHLAERQKRRRRIVTGAVLIIAIAVATAMGVLWRQSEGARQQAEIETLRAEAGKLIALGELDLDSYPTAALAWATKSLELADTLEGRKLTLRALHRGPPATLLRAGPDPGAEGKQIRDLSFSPTGDWLATAGSEDAEVHFHDGHAPIDVGHYSRTGQWLGVAFGADDLLVTDQGGDLRWWSIPEGEELRRAEGDQGRLHFPRGEGYFSISTEEGQESIYWWPFAERASRRVGSMPPWQATTIDVSGSRMAYSLGETIFWRSLEDWSQPPRQLAEHRDTVLELAFHPSGESVAAVDESGEIQIWPIIDGVPEPLRVLQAGELRQILYDPSGRWLAAQGVVDGSPTVRLWDLSAPQGASPLTLKRTDDVFAKSLTFHPTRPWLVTSNMNSAGFWPLETRYPWTLTGHEGWVFDVAFTPDGMWLISAGSDGVRACPLADQNDGASRVLLRKELRFAEIDLQSSGRQLAVATQDGKVLVIPLDGGPVRELTGYAPSATGAGILVAFSPSGRLLAAVPRFAPAEESVIRVWDLDSNDVQTLGPVAGQSAYLEFDDHESLHWSGASQSGQGGGDKIFNLVDGSIETLADAGSEWFRTVSRSRTFSISVEKNPNSPQGFDLVHRDLETGQAHFITSHGDNPWATALDRSDRWLVTGGYSDGLVRVGPVSGKEPHLLYGHRGLVRAVAVSPDGRWIASGGDDGTVRLWPMPDLEKPPFHTRPLDELLETLHSLTNLRVVDDPESSTGWRLETGPFPGWKEVPIW
jgi:WD40 repeat protein